MKLIKCYVSSFGKLKDFSYDFSDGMNTVKEENGWGKTTLSIFIKAMFYGLDGSGKKSLSENERLKYKPWNSTETFGGYLQFEWDGKEYKLERFFGNKDSEDTVNLIDLATGKNHREDKDRRWGKRVFEIDEEGFLSTTFFSQKDMRVKSNTSITAKYNSVCEIQDTTAFDKALTKVEDKIKTYKYRGDKGLIPDCKRKLCRIEEEIERVSKALDTVGNLKEETKKLESEANELNKRVEKFTAAVAAAGELQVVAVKKERYDELQKEYKDLAERRQELDRILGGKRPTEKELSVYSERAKEMTSLVTAENVITVEIEKMEGEIARREKERQNKGKALFARIAFVSFFALGLSTVWFNAFIGIAGFALSFVSLLIVGLKKLTATKNNKTKDLEEMLIEKKKQLSVFLGKKRNCTNELGEFICGMHIPIVEDYLQTAEYVKNVVIERNELDRKIDSALEGLEKLKPFAIRYVKESVGTGNSNGLKEELDYARREYEKKTNELAAKRASVLRYEEYSEYLADLEGKKAETIENLQTYKEDFSVLNLTAEYLKKADENLKIKYRAPLEKSLNKYLKLIDPDACVKIDIDLNVTAVEKTGEKSTEYYSKGYQNLFEICKRFALIDVLFTGEKPFIILDDPFYNLDDEKLKSALGLLNKLSEEYQILYFVCHESRRA